MLSGRSPEVTLHDLPARLVAAAPPTPSASVSYREALGLARREAITRALTQAQGNRAAAAKVLGIHRAHLLQLMKALGIE